MSDEAEARAAYDLAESVYPLFTGKGEKVQAAAIAHLTVTWLMGYYSTDGAEATRKLRLNMLAAHHAALRQIIEGDL